MKHIRTTDICYLMEKAEVLKLNFDSVINQLIEHDIESVQVNEKYLINVCEDIIKKLNSLSEL